MYMYKLEAQEQPISVWDELSGVTRVRFQYAIYDHHGELHKLCPGSWSEQEVLREVHRLNAEVCAGRGQVGPACSPDSECPHG